jgi:hypothetical protein
MRSETLAVRRTGARSAGRSRGELVNLSLVPLLLGANLALEGSG